MQGEQGKNESKQVFQFMPLTLHMETVGGIATPLVLRGTKLPATRIKTFTTAEDNQESVEIKLFLGESPLTDHNHSIGKYRLQGIKKATQGVPEIKLNIEINKKCCISLKIMEGGTQNEIREEVVIPEHLLNKEQIASILKVYDAIRSTDESAVKAIELRNRAERTIAKAEKFVRNTHNLEIEQGIADLGLALESDDANLIATRSQSLDRLITKNNANVFDGAFTNDIFSGIFGNLGIRAQATKRPNTARQRSDNVQEAEKKEAVKSPEASKLQIGKIFGGSTYTQDSNLCFVLMPFSEDMDAVYEDHIKTTVEKQGLSCVRADEIVGINAIINDIWERINRARFLIADLTAKNPNVFYEIGLAHAIGKEVILLTQDINDVPFDLRQLRCIVYSSNPRGARALETKLLSTVQEIMRAG